uniref:Uncharacterized protein n=1 Tax=Steinernema glaseri TaxID=37863 RepID=A0A1I7ZMH3_9BILA
MLEHDPTIEYTLIDIQTPSPSPPPPEKRNNEPTIGDVTARRLIGGVSKDARQTEAVVEISVFGASRTKEGQTGGGTRAVIVLEPSIGTAFQSLQLRSSCLRLLGDDSRGF